LKPVEAAFKCRAPALFIHAMEDDFIEMKNTQENFDAYSGEIKEIAFCEGDHNSERPDEIKDQILKFFIKHLKN